MQLKKNPRDPQHPGAQAEYDEEFETEDEAAEVLPEQQITRTRTRTETEGEAPARNTARGESLIDAHSTFDGKYETEQDLRIQGNISGEISCRGVLTIEQGAIAKAKINSHDVVVRGHVEGDIVCSGRLVLASTAVATGTMKAAALVVEEGASVSGTVETTASASVTPLSRALEAAAPAPAPEAEAAAPTAPAAASNRPSWGNERRSASNGSEASSGGRGSRQAPNFAFVPTTEERAATADRN